MRRLCRALALYFGCRFTWRRCWELADRRSLYHVVARDGFLFIEPRQRSGLLTVDEVMATDVRDNIIRGYWPRHDTRTSPPKSGSGVAGRPACD